MVMTAIEEDETELSKKEVYTEAVFVS